MKMAESEDVKTEGTKSVIRNNEAALKEIVKVGFFSRFLCHILLNLSGRSV